MILQISYSKNKEKTMTYKERINYFQEITSIEQIARWIIEERVSDFGTNLTILYQSAMEAVNANWEANSVKFASPVEWAYAASEKADAVVDYIIDNDKCIVPIRNW